MRVHFSNFLSKLKNASLAKKPNFKIKFNKSFLPFLNALYKENLILSYCKEKGYLLITLRYMYSLSILKDLKIISTISTPVFLNKFDISQIYENERVLLLSTSRGTLSSIECKIFGIGGVLLVVY